MKDANSISVLPRSPLHIDAYCHDAEALLASDISGPAMSAAEQLIGLTTRENPRYRRLSDAFATRFGREAVSVKLALDADFGADLGAVANGQDEYTRRLTEFLVDRLSSARSQHGGIDLLEFTGRFNASQEVQDGIVSGVVHFSAAPNGHSTYEITIKGVRARTGIEMISRFCGSSTKLEEHAKRHLARVETHLNGAIIADIRCNTATAVRDVATRPLLTQTSVPIFEHANSSFQCNIDDLYLVVSGGRLRLWDQKHQRELVPASLTALQHEHHTQHPVYRWLPEIGEPTYVGFAWPELFVKSEYLPEVRIGKVTVSPARWRISEKVLVSFKKAGVARRLELFRRWCEDRKIGNLIDVGSGDQYVRVNVSSREQLNAIAPILTEDWVEIVEVSRRHAFCVNADASEFLLPFVRRTAENSDTSDKESRTHRGDLRVYKSAIDQNNNYEEQRKWSTYKFYCSSRLVDQLLRVLARDTAFKEICSLAQKWFFVRYADPQPHLRVRFSSDAATSHVIDLKMKGLLNKLLSHGYIRSRAIEPYEREIWRYGGTRALTRLEDYFFFDSLCVLGLRNIWRNTSRPKKYYELTALCRSLMSLSHAAGLDSGELSCLVDAEVGRIMRSSASARSVVSNWETRYKSDDLITALSMPVDRQRDIQSVISARDRNGGEALREMARLCGAGEASQSLESILLSLHHMTANRLLSSSNGECEFGSFAVLRRFFAEKRFRGEVWSLTSPLGLGREVPTEPEGTAAG